LIGKRLEVRRVMGNMLKEQQGVVVLTVVVNERKEFVVRHMELLRGNELLPVVKRKQDSES
jgi:hypothetical protein